MSSLLRIAPFVIIPLLLPTGHPAAQTSSADVTFVVPLNITNLASDITKVRVTCIVRGTALDAQRVGELELAVSGRQVITTAQVVVLVPASAVTIAAGLQANYNCTLAGYSPALGWHPFRLESQGSSAGGSFLVTSPTAYRDLALVGDVSW
jgi:hypothetical protein